ncbi:hypothetical protein [Oceanithermus sp.]
MRRLAAFAAWLLLLGLATEPLRLGYDQQVLLPSSARQVELSGCPVPSGFWTPLEEKGWVSECYVASGDPKILYTALEISLKRAGYHRESTEKHVLSGTTVFYIDIWKAGNRQLFIETFLFTDQNSAVYLIAHPPH